MSKSPLKGKYMKHLLDDRLVSSDPQYEGTLHWWLLGSIEANICAEFLALDLAKEI